MGHGDIRRTNYDVIFDGDNLGLLDDVSPELAMMLEPVKTGSTGNMKLDDRFTGLEDDARITVQVREINRTQIERLMPWFTGTANTGDIPLTPATNALMSTHAKLLVLHPRDQGTTLTQDLVILKAFPRTGYQLPRTGTEDDVWEIEFLIYPDVSKIGTADNPYGYVGTPPSGD